MMVQLIKLYKLPHYITKTNSNQNMTFTSWIQNDYNNNNNKIG